MEYTWKVSAKKIVRYPLIIKSNCTDSLTLQKKDFGNVENICVLYDKNVQPLAEKILSQQTLPSFGIAVPGSEDSKSLRQYERIVQTLLEKGANSRSMLIIVGGGTLCDLGGFIAGTYKRGIRCILVPTTFTAMIDAAIGGKNAINIGMLKNCVGTVHHPSAVYIDTSLVQKQSLTFIESGLVEILKLAAMQSSEFFGWVTEHHESILEKQEETITQCIKHAIDCKQHVLSDEEFTKPLLSSTYFGHSIGHAIEALSKFSITHTQAVSIGMITELRMTKSVHIEQLSTLLKKLHQPTEIPIEIRTQELWDILRASYPETRNIVVCVPKPLGTAQCVECTFEDLVRSRDTE